MAARHLRKGGGFGLRFPLRRAYCVRLTALRRQNFIALLLGGLLALEPTRLSAAERTPLVPEYPQGLRERPLATWGFSPTTDWPALHQATLSVTNGTLQVLSSGEDPNLRIPLAPVPGPLVLRWRMRTQARGPVELFWTTAAASGFSPLRSVRVRSLADGQWHECRAEIPTPETLTALRLDPATAPGPIELAEATLSQRVLPALHLEQLEAGETTIRGTLRNPATNALAFSVTGPLGRVTNGWAPAGAGVSFQLATRRSLPFESVRLEVQAQDGAPLTRTLYLHHAAAQTEWLTVGHSNLLVQVAADGSGARLLWRGQLAAFICPLAECQGASVPLQAARSAEAIELRGGPVSRLRLRVEGDELVCELTARERVTGPVVRAVGGLEQGLLAGVEYLGRGEVSSSTLDLERLEHLRFEPDPLWLTLPLAAFVTDRASVALLWDDPELQPVFSTPNRYDGTADHLMAVKGQHLGLRVRVGAGFAAGGRLEDSLLWAVDRRGLPALPAAPRTVEEQRRLELHALTSSLRSSNGWWHAAWPGAQAQFFADHASTLWRLTGEVPQLPRLVPGGAHVENPPGFFVTGRAAEWLRAANARAASTRREQQPDGSFRYRGKYQRGHFEDTASGYCARPAALLLEHAWLTGNAESLAAGLKTLEYMKRFRTPRGAQTWEMPLHTPDLVASAWLVQAYTRGYELTQLPEYLDLARRWALSGLPFVYQWGRYPTQAYATIGVLGATDWNGVVWLGLPVQWCGSTYAYALTLLEPYDHTLDWHHLAQGILRTAQRMEYPEGPWAGCLPDSFELADQLRLPAGVNPCVLVALRLRLAGQLDGLAVAADAHHRVVAPFPVQLRGNRAVISAPPGMAYEVLEDGSRLRALVSHGVDELNLE